MQSGPHPAVGRRARHGTFGEGKIVAVQNDDGRLKYVVDFPGVGPSCEVGEVAADQVRVTEPLGGAGPARAPGRDALVDFPGAAQGREKIAGDPLGLVFLLPGIPVIQHEVAGTLVNPHFARRRKAGGKVREPTPTVLGAVPVRPGSFRDLINPG